MTQINPLNPDFVPRLDEEYVTFYNANLVNRPQLHELPWDPSVRSGPPVLGGSDPLPVGSIRDIDLAHCKARVFTPEGAAPEAGWPCFIFFHGGGWTLGNINTENSFSTRMCKGAKCVVVSVDYRLAPEIPYPAAVKDAEDALIWVWKRGKEEINVDVTRLAVGGSSSGGNLAAILTFIAANASPPIPLKFQLLVVPVTDNTASLSGIPHASWLENANTPQLNVGRMMWFRNNYLPNKEDWGKWDSSPLLAPDEWFAKVPKAWIGVAELDILRDEGLAYADKLKKAGVQVEVKEYKRAPHPIMAMDGVLQIGRDLVADAAKALDEALS